MFLYLPKREASDFFRKKKGIGKIREIAEKDEGSITYFHPYKPTLMLFFSLCVLYVCVSVCMCPLLIYTISISILCVTQEGLILIE